MIDEIKANFETLLRDYPSGMSVNSLLAAKYFSLRQEYVVVGNGAAELIKSLMENIDGTIGMIYPTFEEYPNRLPSERIVIFNPCNEDFSYTADEIITYFSDNKVENLLIVNPDNPSGNFIGKDGLEKLLKWTSTNDVRLIIDESFVDFADSLEDVILLRNDMLERNPHLCVMKSISKSYGVPGLRLGVLASSDYNLINLIRKDVGIWNINSFAEFYMQIYGKYEKEYLISCDRFREERKVFCQELSQIPFIRVIPSQANYFLCEISNGYSTHELTLKLLTDFNILIKDCTNKKGFTTDKQYVRIAIRDREDNQKLIEALKSL